MKLVFEKLLSPATYERRVFLKKQNPITIVVVDNFVRPLLEKMDFYYEKVGFQLSSYLINYSGRHIFQATWKANFTFSFRG